MSHLAENQLSRHALASARGGVVPVRTAVAEPDSAAPAPRRCAAAPPSPQGLPGRWRPYGRSRTHSRPPPPQPSRRCLLQGATPRGRPAGTLGCHRQDMTENRRLGAVGEAAHPEGAHRTVRCTVCHTDAAPGGGSAPGAGPARVRRAECGATPGRRHRAGPRHAPARRAARRAPVQADAEPCRRAGTSGPADGVRPVPARGRVSPRTARSAPASMTTVPTSC